MDSISDILRAKADELDVDGRKTELDLIADVIKRHHGPASVKALKSADKKIILSTPNAPLASEIKYNTGKLLTEINRVTGKLYGDLIIRIVD